MPYRVSDRPTSVRLVETGRWRYLGPVICAVWGAWLVFVLTSRLRHGQWGEIVGMATFPTPLFLWALVQQLPPDAGARGIRQVDHVRRRPWSDFVAVDAPGRFEGSVMLVRPSGLREETGFPVETLARLREVSGLSGTEQVGNGASSSAAPTA